MKKLVNGQEVECSAEEAAAIQAEWDAWRPERRKVLKSVIVQRLIDAGKIGDANAALETDPSAKARWYMPGKEAINHDDAEAVAFIKALGLDPAVVLAP